MAASPPATKDFIRNLECPDSSKDDDGEDSDTPGKKQPKSSSDSCSGKAWTLHDDGDDGLRNCIFKKSLEKTYSVESPSRIARRHWIPGFGVVSTRQPSFLERELLPGIRNGAISLDNKSAPSQLTIFYAGAVNVYDHVPADKARAIMLLAGESCSAKPMVAEPQEQTGKREIKPCNQTSFPSIFKLQASDLPIARRNSLRRFLEKRHGRITNMTPYAASLCKEDEIDQSTDESFKLEGGNECPSLSPFPSRLEYFCPVPSNKG